MFDTLRFRHIHLDYHTSEKIPGIGSEFNADEFVDTLKRGHVDSVCVFSRCHHGMIYHDTKFAAKHPFLTCNLLAEQIEACHKNDIRAPIYITVGLDEYMAREHPEWVEVSENGGRTGAPPLAAGWRKLDFASPYIDYVIEQTEEVLDMFGDEVDGFFFDIINQRGVHSKWCLELFEKNGWDPADPKAQEALRKQIIDTYKERLTAAVRRKHKTCTIFHNSGHIMPDWRNIIDTYTHLEVESLPSGGWGYAHFPITARYARTWNLDYFGHTGKFHKSWGHFNSYKPVAALEYECFNMLALAGKCGIGDQLHPSGVLDGATYDLIGEVYKQVEAVEEWCEDAVALCDIAVFNTEAVGRHDARVDSSNLGAYRMLVEGHHQFDYVDGEADWSGYKVVVLPDKVVLDEVLAAKVNGFVAAGGKLLLSHESGLNEVGGRFVVDGLDLEYQGELPYHPDFLKPLGDLAEGIRDAVYVMYERGSKVKANGGEVLAEIWEPYFNRAWDHFCSHAHTPPEKQGEDPGVVQQGGLLYFAHPIFACFGNHGMPFYKQVLLNALNRLLPDPLVKTDGPSTLHITVNRQEQQKRHVAHLLHYIPERRTSGPDYLEDIIPLHNVELQVRGSASRAYLAPSGEELTMRTEGDYTVVTVPEVRGHALVVFDD